MFTKRNAVLTVVLAFVLAAAALTITFSFRDDKGEEERTYLLELWQIDSFEGGKGSRASFLQARADELFEGSRVHVVVTSLSSDAARANISQGVIPDMISYGAGFYGIESLINPADFTYECWCRGAYFYLSLEGDFSDVSPRNTIVNEGVDNLSNVCAALEGLSVCVFEKPTAAYLSLLNGKYKYLLGTQRDIFRLEARGADYSARVITSFNDLYQNISILCDDEKYAFCRDFVEYLLKNGEKVSSLGLIADGAALFGPIADADEREYEYSVKSFVGREYVESVNEAVQKNDLNSLKNLLK